MKIEFRLPGTSKTVLHTHVVEAEPHHLPSLDDRLITDDQRRGAASSRRVEGPTVPRRHIDHAARCSATCFGRGPIDMHRCQSSSRLQQNAPGYSERAVIHTHLPQTNASGGTRGSISTGPTADRNSVHSFIPQRVDGGVAPLPALHLRTISPSQ
mmetsp:Transcript_3379/g.8128  ORF Transcript_3379/g.8128 Transcript_3379/m.8128 type:complete len:155 (+) Transcript_3379:223-687(+)